MHPFMAIGNNGLNVPREINGGVPVNVQDQVTPPFDLFGLKLVNGAVTLTADTAIDERIVTVSDPTDFSVGTYVGIFSGISGENRFYFGEVLNKSGSDLTLDTPLDFAFEADDAIIPASRNLNVNGSITPVKYEIKGPGTGSEIEVDVTMLTIIIEATSAVNLNTFGNLAALARGLVLRRVDGEHRNVWNVKTNGELAALCGPNRYQVFQASNPAQAVDGLIAQYPLAGQANHGVTIRLGANESFEVIIQDDLSSLVKLHVIAPGHQVTD